MRRNEPKPPFFASMILKIFNRRNDGFSLSGDFEEEFYELAEEKGEKYARKWYRRNMLRSVPLIIRDSVYWRFTMFKNYIKIAYRNAVRSKGITFINIAGLSIALACSILMSLYIMDELSYDDFHSLSDRIYRLGSNLRTSEGQDRELSTNPWPTGKLLAEDYTEIEEILYMRSAFHPVKHKGTYYFDRGLYADKNFFKLFSFNLTKGHPETALEKPFSLVITDKIEKKYFGDNSALGESLVLSDSLNFTITGVVEVPKNSHIQFDMLLSFETYLKFNPDAKGPGGWGNFNMINYILLKPGVDPVDFNTKIRDFPMKRAGELFNQWSLKCYSSIEPLNDLYLRSDRGNNTGPQGNLKTVYFLFIVAALLLIVAGLNFIILTTARSAERAKEVGLRKVVGSTRSRLISQFMSDSLLISFAALIFAFVLMILILPVFNDLTGKSYIPENLFNLNSLLFIFALTFLVAICAGIYPSSVISRFRPADVLKGNYSTSGRGVYLRKILVVSQIVITSALIFCTLVVRDQVNFMLNSNPGFNKNQVIVLDTSRIPWSAFIEKSKVIKQSLSKNPEIQSLTVSNSVPGKYGWNGQWCHPEDFPEQEMLSVEFIPVDHDYVKTFDIEIIAGRDFLKEMATDKEKALLINESSVKVMGWITPENAIGKKIDSPSGYPEGIVVGVFKDYHHHSLQKKINPIVLGLVNNMGGLIALKISVNDIPGFLSKIEYTWNEFFPGYPFSYFFLDEFFDRQYRTEIRLSNIFGSFTFLAIIVACLGLFGLITFSTNQKTKEIGIRKTLGATVPNIALNFMKEYLKLTIYAFVVAVPAAYFLMERWLINFAYRVNIGIHTILLTIFLTASVTVLTVFYRSFKAAKANPVDSLKYE
ncbi:FtsX-like permease family protein [candidate division KSB1 bacterium]